MKKNAIPASRQGFAPLILVLLIAILGIVGYLGYKVITHQLSNIVVVPTSSPTIAVTPTPTKIVKDPSLEKFLKDEFGGCIEYLGENTCTSQDTKTIPPGYSNSGQLEVAIIQAISGNFALVGVGSGDHVLEKQNGSWKVVYVNGGGIPDCSEISMIPIGIFGDTLDACFDGNQTILRSTGKPLAQ